jgi:hypothetical protein
MFSHQPIWATLICGAYILWSLTCLAHCIDRIYKFIITLVPHILNKENVRSHIKRARPSSPHIVNTRNVCIMDVCVGHLAFWCGYGVRIFLWGWHYYKMWVQFISPYSVNQWIHCIPITSYSLQRMISLLDLILCNEWFHWKSSEIAWRIRIPFAITRRPSNW